VLDNKKAIRGGIPLVFPQFGAWALGPSHGFARISMWALAEQGATPEGDTYAVFQLNDSEETRNMWDHAFQLRYTVTLGKTRLSTSLSVENKGSGAFDFQTLLHTYFRVPSVDEAAVGGLRGVHYRDQVGG
jgi:glucose-6-phosphate 1-epimerase